jgi:hypothetical protein
MLKTHMQYRVEECFLEIGALLKIKGNLRFSRQSRRQPGACFEN